MVDCVTSVAILCTVAMCNVSQGNDLKFFFKNRQPRLQRITIYFLLNVVLIYCMAAVHVFCVISLK